MKINKGHDDVAAVETLEQWKEKVSELESSVSEVEAKFKPEKDMKKEYGEIEAVINNIQVRKVIEEYACTHSEVIIFQYLNDKLLSVNKTYCFPRAQSIIVNCFFP